MDDCGFDMLGADASSLLATQQASLAQLKSNAPVVTMTQSSQDARAFRTASSTMMAPVYGSLIGSVVFGIGGALAWATHRVAGGLLGGLLVGPAIGGSVGFVIAARKITDTVATKMERK